MSRIKTVLVAACAVLSSVFFVKPLCAESSDIIFVSTKKELADASAQMHTLKGLAVNIRFDKRSDGKTQKEVSPLIEPVISMKLRPVFLYGQPFDNELAKRLLVTNGKFEDGSGCTPTAWAAIFPKPQDTVKMCGADDNPRSEINFRKWISSDWKETKTSIPKEK